MKNIVIVGSGVFVNRIAPLAREGNNKFVAMNKDAENELEKNKISFESTEKYFSDKDYKEISKEAERITNNWYKLWGLNYCGFSLGSLVEVEFYNHPSFNIFEIIKNLKLMENIIEKNKQSNFFILDNKSLASRIAILAAKQKGLSFKVINTGASSNLKYFIAKKLIPYTRNYLKNYRDLYRRIRWKNVAQKSDVLIIPSTRNHVVTISPVIKEMKKRGIKATVVAIDIGGMKEPVTKQLKSEGIEYNVFEKYITKEINRKVKKEKKNLLRKWDELRQNNDFKNLIYYKDIFFWDIIKDKLEFLFSIRFPEVVKCIEILKNIIEIEKPKLVIVMNDMWWIGKTTVAVTRSKMVKTLSVQHGILGKEGFCGSGLADIQIVSGNFTKKILNKRGLSSDRIIVTGSPRYDCFVNARFNKKIIYEKLRLDPKKGIIILTTQPINRAEKENLINNILGAMKNFPEKQLVIKLHPNEDLRFYKQLIKNSNIPIVKYVDLNALLNVSDLMITVSSTTALEAMILDKPVLIINLTGKPDPMPYVKSGAAIGVYKPEDIVPSIKRILSNKKLRKIMKKKRDRFVFEHAFKRDGKATKGVADLIEKIVKNERSF